MLFKKSCDTPSAKEGGGGNLKGAGKFDILFSYSLDNTWWVLTDKLQSKLDNSIRNLSLPTPTPFDACYAG